jgi:hypothetical protein
MLAVFRQTNSRGEAPAALRRQLELLYQSILVVVTGGEALPTPKLNSMLYVCAGVGSLFRGCLHVKQS